MSAITILEGELGAIKRCLEDEKWASDGSEEAKDVRRRYRKEANDLNRAIKILKKEQNK